MNDLDELLREDARVWQPSHAPVPDLDTALARASARRSKLNTGAALVAVVALAAGAVLIAHQLAPGIPAVPDPLGTPSAPAVTPTPEPAPSAETPVDSLADLTDAIHEYATARGIPAQVEAVSTTWLAAQEFLPTDEPTAGIDGDTDVWVVQAQGQFSCDDCPATQPGPEPSVSTFTMVLAADGFERIWFDLGDLTRPLADLGQLVTLDPDGSTGVLSFTRAVHEQGTRFGIPVAGEAVLITWQQAQQFLPAGAGQIPGRTDVWLIQLRGEFSCDDCQPSQSGPEPSVSVLTLVLDAATFDRYHAEPGDVSRPLDQLGVVQAVDLELVS